MRIEIACARQTAEFVAEAVKETTGNVVEPREPSGGSQLHFGLTEALIIVTIVKSTAEIAKLLVEAVRKKGSPEEAFRLKTPVVELVLTIKKDSSPELVQTELDAQLRAAQLISPT